MKKKDYLAVREALNQSGFGYDPTLMEVTADEEAWEAYIEACPDAQRLKGKVIRHYEELAIIIGNDQAMGDKSVTRHVIPNDTPLPTTQEAFLEEWVNL